tara:strand:- start:164 stop:346 length:183 start_codon:yes stop_codon:yes gene_type:complete
VFGSPEASALRLAELSAGAEISLGWVTILAGSAWETVAKPRPRPKTFAKRREESGIVFIR